jgi:hypothetical protein
MWCRAEIGDKGAVNVGWLKIRWVTLLLVLRLIEDLGEDGINGTSRGYNMLPLPPE